MRMPKRVTVQERQAVLQMLAKSEDRDTIAAAVGITPGQVSAIAAHVTMGTYNLPDVGHGEREADGGTSGDISSNLLRNLRKLDGTHKVGHGLRPILLGAEAETS